MAATSGTVSAQPLDSHCPLQALPTELCWAVVDALLPCKGGARDAARLGLTCRQLASTILDDERAWQSRYRRSFGADRTSLHVEHRRLGVGWLRLYAAVGDHTAFGRRFATIMSGLHDATGFKWRWTSAAVWRCDGYAVSVHVSSLPPSVTVMEHAPHEITEDIGGWVSMHRINHAGAVAPPCCFGFDFKQKFCACVFCRGDSPDARELARARMETYRGEWRDGYPQGQGRAEFANGTVYDGQWNKGLPHGRGLLDGIAHTWVDGVCLGVDSWVEPLDGDDNAYLSYDGEFALLPESAHEFDVALPKDASLWRWWWIVGAVTGPDPHTTIPSDARKRQHGHGKATYSDGGVYSGEWRMGRRDRGRCTLVDGTSLDGVWHYTGPRVVAYGAVSWPSGTSLNHAMVWDDRDEPEPHTRAILRDGLHGHPSCGCATPYPCPSPQWDHLNVEPFTLSNGDECWAKWTVHGIMRAIDGFTFSPASPDPAFAGVVIQDCAWTCVVLPWRRPPRHTCPDDYVYWPSDRQSEAFRLFSSYVRKRLIPWDAKAVDFFWHMTKQESA